MQMQQLSQNCGRQTLICRWHVGSARRAGKVFELDAGQAEEERQHAMIWRSLFSTVAGEVALLAIDAVKIDWADAMVFVDGCWRMSRMHELINRPGR